MSSPPLVPLQPRRSAGDTKKTSPPPSTIVTRNGARKAKIQTRAMSAGAKPSAAVLAAKKKAQQKKRPVGDTILKDYYQIAMDSKTKVKGPTGFVTEPRMAEHRCLWDDNYPECPERLIGVIDRCKELGLIEQCQQFDPRPATKEELDSLHSRSIFELLESTHQNQDLEYLEEVSSRYDAVYIHPSTHELALLSAGSTIDMVERIVSGEVQNGAAFVRPPGHHAMRAEPCGYCFYNNVALAAKHALDRGISRILIVDWDVHHGQATQQMFYDDPRVVYFSIHRYEHGAFWPNLRQSDFHYVGCGRGKGHTFNVPLNHTGMKDADYLAIWHQLLLPMALEYQPELIIISAGYDAAVGCPEGEMEITPACYPHLLNMLMSVCSSVCVVLEGGYCIPSLAEGAALTLRTLLGHAPPRLQALTEPCDSIRETILNAIYAHKPYWRCYNYQPTYSIESTPNVCDGEKQKHTVCVRWEGDETRPERFATRDCYPLQDDETKRKITEKLDHLRIVTDLTLPQHKVCYVYDQAMLKHKNICEPGHVECPERIMRIHERHRDFGLLERLLQLDSRLATDDELLAVHTKKHLNRLKELASTKLRDLNSQTKEFDSVYFHPESLESARVAAGCVLQTVDAVLNNVSGAGVCVVRPPGHHADEEVPSGFCLLNNAATAAKYAIDVHGLKKVLILDWDVHHGNGTQRITYKDNRILYMSIHRYDDGSFFPHSTDADYHSVGEGRGKGFNVNIPWNKRGMGDAEYLAAFTQVVLPIAYEFAPELVIVSAGFDACVGDPLGGCKVSPECYARMTSLVRGLAGGRVILCLEGGYNVTSIAYSMALCTKALLGDPLLHHYDPKATVHWSAVESINNVLKTHKQYWKSLKFQLALPIESVLDDPAPSRGLTVTEDQNTTSETDRRTSDGLSEVSSSTFDDSLKSSPTSKSLSDLNATIEGMAALNVKPKCDDGIHCGTDDEQDMPKDKRPKTDVECFKVDRTIIGKDNGSSLTGRLNEQGPSNVGASSSRQDNDPPSKHAGISVANQVPSTLTEITEKRTVARSRGVKISDSETDSIEMVPSVTVKENVSHVKSSTAHGSTSSSTIKRASKGASPELSATNLAKEGTMCDIRNVSGGVSTTNPNKASSIRIASKTESRLITREKEEMKVSSKPSLQEKAVADTKASTTKVPTKPSSSSMKAVLSAQESKETQGPSKARVLATGEGKEGPAEEGEKKTLVNFLAENMKAIADGEMFAVIPLPWCPHLEGLYAIPQTVTFAQGVKCVNCEETVENWVCLHCYITACGRSINGHMQTHYQSTNHALVLSLLDLSVWCNECDAYVDHALLYDAKNNAHRAKFNEDMPWCYKSDTIHMD